MNAFAEGLAVEQRGMLILIPFIRLRAHDGQFIIVNKGTSSIFLQRTVGDVLLNTSSSTMTSVEIKCEEDARHGNFFFETWSNKNLNDKNAHASRGSTPGWMLTLRCDWLMYYFVSTDDLYVMDFFKLKHWMFSHETGRPVADKYPERLQSKRRQMNDTWGRCVPICDVSVALGNSFKLIHPLAFLADNAKFAA